MSEEAATSELTNKHQVTIPPSVRKALGLDVGDTVAFDIMPGHGVHLRRADPEAGKLADADEVTRATEPLSDADEKSFRNL